MGIRSQNNPIAAYLDVFSNTGTDAAGAAPPGSPSGLTATGGVISDYTSGSDVYRAHIFTSSGALNVTALGDFGNTVDYLVVAGGGASGYSAYSGGGGAGGFRTNLTGHPLASPSTFVVSTSPGSYTVTVGAGGAGNASYGTDLLGSPGNPSSFVSPNSPETITSTGGGRGGAYINQDDGASGGSGGGGAANGGSAGAGNTPPSSPPQGNNGGAGNGTGGAGGGGAGGAGLSAAAPGAAGGVAGAGSPISINGSNVTYAAGGAGEVSASQNGTAGAEGTGNGGIANGATGGSGIVVVRYKIAQLTATAKATGGTISFYGGKTIHAFTSAGNFVTPGTFSETVEYVAIGGGGAGGGANPAGSANNGSGGGGAGGYTTASVSLSGPKTSVVTIGAGGGARSTLNTAHQPGSDTTITNFPGTITAGYGAGGQFANSGPTAAAPLGSGGGSGAGAGNTGSGSQGNDGGAAASDSPYSGGGGGGAGGVGQDRGTYGGSGGIGIRLPATFRDPSQAPTSVDGGGLGAIGPGPSDTNTFWVAGGGGGGSYPGAPGGSGGGAPTPDVRYAGGGSANRGNHPSYTPEVQQLGVVNTGGGGGGVSPFGNTTQTQQQGFGGSGGSGLLLIAYPS